MGVHESRSRGSWRTRSAAAGPSPSGSIRRCATPSASSASTAPEDLFRAVEPGRDRLHPHRGGRGPLQPSCPAALRSGAGADRAATLRWPTSKRPGTTASPPTSGVRRRTGPGALQDVHWSVGAFGYFPTYTLGNVYAAELDAALRADLPDLDARLAAGDLAPVLGWLRPRIHRRGRSLPPAHPDRRSDRPRPPTRRRCDGARDEVRRGLRPGLIVRADRSGRRPVQAIWRRSRARAADWASFCGLTPSIVVLAAGASPMSL